VHEGIDKGIEFKSTAELPGKQSFGQVMDCSGKYVTKSFGVGHHHIYSALAKGMPPPKKTPENFLEILQYVWWTLDKCLDKDTIEASALASAIACAKAGSTFVIDHHASPNYIKGSLEIIAEAFDKVGVSHLLCYEITDRDGLDKAAAGLEETDSYLKKQQGLVGLHASFTIGDESLEKAAKLAKEYDSGIHIHVAEGIYDQEQAINNYGKRVVERLNDLGLLQSSKSILVHGLHLDDNERRIISKSNCWVVQNMESNLNNNVGYFNGAGLGNNIMLGTDGMHCDMLQSAKAAFFVGQRYDNVDFPGVYERFRNIHRYVQQNNFRGDGENNLVILDYDAPTPFSKENFLGHFVFGLNSNHVNSVISNGKLVVKDKKVLSINEDDVLAFTREQAKRLWRCMSKS
jgi:cytosine/adenosine deaminase-related metal-dependent hydrolase